MSYVEKVCKEGLRKSKYLYLSFVTSPTFASSLMTNGVTSASLSIFRSCAIISISPVGKFLLILLPTDLRSKGLRVEQDLMARSAKAQMKYANKLGAKYVAILGEDDFSLATWQTKIFKHQNKPFQAHTKADSRASISTNLLLYLSRKI